MSTLSKPNIWILSTWECTQCNDEVCSLLHEKLSTILDPSSESNPENHNDIKEYLESKIELYSQSIPSLNVILATHMELNVSCEDKGKLRQSVKEELITAGIYDDYECLEFLIILSEKYRTFDNIPLDWDDTEIWKYFFDKYKTDELWSHTDFRFFLDRANSGHRMDRVETIESVVINMIASARGHLDRVNETPDKITEYIKEIDNYFQESFKITFWKPSPVRLTEITLLNNQNDNFADKISGRTFIDKDTYYSDKGKFTHLVIHEAMHLSFPWFYNNMFEEALIELFIEKMYLLNPNSAFPYSPVSQTYWAWVKNLKSISAVLPWFETHLSEYFVWHDVSKLSLYLEKELTPERISEISKNHYSSNIDYFIDTLDEHIKDEL